jgi:hypothetical protein
MLKKKQTPWSQTKSSSDRNIHTIHKKRCTNQLIFVCFWSIGNKFSFMTKNDPLQNLKNRQKYHHHHFFQNLKHVFRPVPNLEGWGDRLGNVTPILLYNMNNN